VAVVARRRRPALPETGYRGTAGVTKDASVRLRSESRVFVFSWFPPSIMLQNRRIVWPSYLVAFSLLVIPPIDALMQTMPAHPSEPRWRWGAFGLLSNAMMIPMIGLLKRKAERRLTDTALKDLKKRVEVH